MIRRSMLGDDGTGTFASAAAVLVFLCFLMFATQLALGLHGTSVVTAVAHEGARRVATSGTDPTDAAALADVRGRAEQHMRAQLGTQGERTSFDWSGSDASTVVLRIVSPNPRLMIPGLSGSLVTDTVDRTVSARVEHLR